jgi:outer membrane protein OmpA-like peptidoglycan-associated protein
VAAWSGAAAQSAGTVEIGGFGRYAWFDNKLVVDNKAGGGGALGIYFVPNLALEGEASYVGTNTKGLTNSVSNVPIRGRLTYNIPLSASRPTSFQLGAGYVYDIFGKNVDFKSSGITGLAGVRFGFGEHVALRVDGTIDYVPSPKQPLLDNYTNWGVQGGLTLLLGNSYDSDHDGVKNKADRCPKTPPGEPVDASGCSASQRDTDRDGVKDNADKCPNTTAGQPVDANGCAPSQLDADADGIVDNLDKCPGTPPGEAVDQNGCGASQRDADRDKVSDAADKCPNTPPGEEVDQHGCSASQRDSDGDGVNDANDKCPDTPKGAPVDSRGCPSDADGDGVPDYLDKCPNTPNGQAVDQNGCPVLFKEGARKVVLQGVNFATGKAALTPESNNTLQGVASSLAANPDVRVVVAGFTDNTGSAATNRRLSQQRATTVEQFLLANGVSPSQIAGAKGYGPNQPVASNKTAAGRTENRRVELRRVD